MMENVESCSLDEFDRALSKLKAMGRDFILAK